MLKMLPAATILAGLAITGPLASAATPGTQPTGQAHCIAAPAGSPDTSAPMFCPAADITDGRVVESPAFIIPLP
jgi:hypothetical protein